MNMIMKNHLEGVEAILDAADAYCQKIRDASGKALLEDQIQKVRNEFSQAQQQLKSAA